VKDKFSKAGYAMKLMETINYNNFSCAKGSASAEGGGCLPAEASAQAGAQFI
jgi:hypothetical protein